jgi:hypothetical protein
VAKAACQIAENLEGVEEFVAPASRRLLVICCKLPAGRCPAPLFCNAGNDFSSTNVSGREDRGLVRGNFLIAERLHEAKKESDVGQAKRKGISEHSRAFAPADALPA